MKSLFIVVAIWIDEQSCKFLVIWFWSKVLCMGKEATCLQRQLDCRYQCRWNYFCWTHWSHAILLFVTIQDAKCLLALTDDWFHNINRGKKALDAYFDLNATGLWLCCVAWPDSIHVCIHKYFIINFRIAVNLVRCYRHESFLIVKSPGLCNLKLHNYHLVEA